MSIYLYSNQVMICVRNIICIDMGHTKISKSAKDDMHGAAVSRRYIPADTG